MDISVLFHIRFLMKPFSTVFTRKWPGSTVDEYMCVQSRGPLESLSTAQATKIIFQATGGGTIYFKEGLRQFLFWKMTGVLFVPAHMMEKNVLVTQCVEMYFRWKLFRAILLQLLKVFLIVHKQYYFTSLDVRRYCINVVWVNVYEVACWS